MSDEAMNRSVRGACNALRERPAAGADAGQSALAANHAASRSARARVRYTVPAVVLGMELNGLGVVRSLARAGVPVIAVDDDPGRPAMRSRYGRKVGVRALHGDALVDDLVALGKTFPERPVLFLTQEAAVHTVSAHREALAPYYRMTLADTGVLETLMHKQSFQHVAERYGFRVPRSVYIVDADTVAAAQTLRYPAILKPGSKSADYGRSFDKAYRVENFAAVEPLCRQILPVLPDLILQEWIAGDDADIYFCLQYIRPDGAPAASFCGRKIRSWPPEVGGTASCIAAPEVAAELEGETARFFRAVGFVGMGGMEYKRDRTSGEFYLVEPTVGRTDYQEEVATLNGVNLPLAAYCSELGLERPFARVPARPLVWRESATDRWSASMQQQVCGRGPLDSGDRVDGWWRWYDPEPWLTKSRHRLLKAIRRRLPSRRPGGTMEKHG